MVSEVIYDKDRGRYIATVGKAQLPGTFTSIVYAERAIKHYIAKHNETLNKGKYSKRKRD